MAVVESDEFQWEEERVVQKEVLLYM